MAKNKGGRPTVMTPEVIRKLEEAFANGATDLQACFYAGIGKSSLYEYQEKNPDFTERKEGLKAQLGLIAKNVLGKAIRSGNESRAAWYVERTEKETFGLRQDHHVTGDLTIEIVRFTDAKNKTSE